MPNVKSVLCSVVCSLKPSVQFLIVFVDRPSRDHFVMDYTHERPLFSEFGGSSNKNVPWFTRDVDDSEISKSARELLQTYSGIPADEVLPHILAMVSR